MVAALAGMQRECCCLSLVLGGAGVTEPPVRFGSLLRKLRQEARLTQEELADTLHLVGPARAEFEAG